VIILVLVIALLIIFLPPLLSPVVQPPLSGEKKAIILGSANDFYRKDGRPDFNDGEDSKFDTETVGWSSGLVSNNGQIVTESNWPGHDTPGFVQFIVYTPPPPSRYCLLYTSDAADDSNRE